MATVSARRSSRSWPGGVRLALPLGLVVVAIVAPQWLLHPSPSNLESRARDELLAPSAFAGANAPVPVIESPPSGLDAAPPNVAAAVELPGRARLSPGLSAWLQVERETALWSAPADGAEFTRLPPGATLRTLERRGSRYRVHYPGDEERRRAGEAWVDQGDVRDAPWPRFVRTRLAASVRERADERASVVAQLPARQYLEVLELQGRDWARVFLATESSTGRPVEGWLDVEDAAATPRPPSEFQEFVLSRSHMPEVWLTVPYRSQLNGAAYAAANCGPTVLWMALRALEAVGIDEELRPATLRLQDIDECDDCGVFIEHMAEVASQRGAQVVGLFEGGTSSFHRWSIEEIRDQLRQGRPVVPQVMYRQLSGHEQSDYWGDHYIVITGFAGDRFIYHDPVNNGGPGASRTISAAGLARAMGASDYPHAAFAIDWSSPRT